MKNLKLFNFFWKHIRRYGKSKKYKLTYNPKPKTLQVWYNGLLMIPKIDYKFNKKINSIIFSFLPPKGAKIEIRAIGGKDEM